MKYPSLEVTISPEGVAQIVIDRPEARNALNAEVLSSLARAFADLSDDEKARAIVLRGRGDKAFCAGADLKEWQEREGVAGYRTHFGGVAEVVEAISKCPKPTIASVDGFALAGGCGLAAVCDVTIATKRSQFGLPEIRIGLIPAIVMAPIFRAIGHKKGVELVLRGNRLTGEEAEACGLITRCVEDGKLEEETWKIARELAGCSPLTLRLSKDAIRTLGDMEYYASIRYLREVISLASLTEDAAEGVASFFEKRDPVWKGK